MTAVLETTALGKQYGRRWALDDCTLAIPAGKVVGLVGPNGAGKTTLLHLAVGLLAPTSGTIEVLGGHPAEGPAQMGRVGFVAQETPTYARLSVAKHLRMGGFCLWWSRRRRSEGPQARRPHTNRSPVLERST
jgi:ABC-2 type transport system ATP-binding protein